MNDALAELIEQIGPDLMARISEAVAEAASMTRDDFVLMPPAELEDLAGRLDAAGVEQ